VIEKRHAHFEGDGHAGGVGVAQQTLTDEPGELQERDGVQQLAAFDALTPCLGDVGGQTVPLLLQGVPDDIAARASWVSLVKRA